jgi:hypothetical protein
MRWTFSTIWACSLDALGGACNENFPPTKQRLDVWTSAELLEISYKAQ